MTGKAELISIFLLLLLFSNINLHSQSESPWNQAPTLEVHGYIDVFYCYDFNQPTTGYRQPFFYNHNRHVEFNVNNANIGLVVNQTKYHATVTLQAGTYASDNYYSEEELLKNIYEAYAGLALNKKNNLWLDAGIFISHLGFESPLVIDNFTLTQSLSSENLPYFLAGAKVTWTTEKITLLGGVYNGWQQIRRTKGGSYPSFGIQVLVTPNENISLNYSNFFGSNDPDSTRRNRLFNNFFAKFNIADRFDIIAGFDIGIQQKQKSSNDYDIWYDWTLIAHYNIAKKWDVAARAEYYQDENLANISLDNDIYGFRTYGLSANLDFRPVQQVACRIEGRWLHSLDPIFTKQGTPTKDNFFITASIEVKMGKVFL